MANRTKATKKPKASRVIMMSKPAPPAGSGIRRMIEQQRASRFITRSAIHNMVRLCVLKRRIERSFESAHQQLIDDVRYGARREEGIPDLALRDGTLIIDGLTPEEIGDGPYRDDD